MARPSSLTGQPVTGLSLRGTSRLLESLSVCYLPPAALGEAEPEHPPSPIQHRRSWSVTSGALPEELGILSRGSPFPIVSDSAQIGFDSSGHLYGGQSAGFTEVRSQ